MSELLVCAVEVRVDVWLQVRSVQDYQAPLGATPTSRRCPPVSSGLSGLSGLSGGVVCGRVVGGHDGVMLDYTKFCSHLPSSLVAVLAATSPEAESAHWDAMVRAANSYQSTLPFDAAPAAVAHLERCWKHIVASRMFFEGQGDVLPLAVTVRYVRQWATEGFARPPLPDPSCPHCGARVEAPPHEPGCDVVSDDAGEVGVRVVLECRVCDVGFGASWLSVADRRLQLGLPPTGH